MSTSWPSRSSSSAKSGLVAQRVHIRGAVGAVVSSLANDILMPIISLVLPAGDWREAKYVLSSTTDAAGVVSESAILYGQFAAAVLDFIIISFVVFIIVKRLVKPVPEPATPQMRKCPECFEMIPEDARRCRACTSTIGAGSQLAT